MQLASSTSLLPPAMIINAAASRFSDAQGIAADMLNSDAFDATSTGAAIRQITEGVNLLGTIPPGGAGYTDVDFAAESARTAVDELNQALRYVTGGTDPSPVQLEHVDNAFLALESAIEALNNG